MAFNGDDGAANNGFPRRSLQQWEGRLLHQAGYPAPPDTRAPGGWRLSAGGVPIPPPPQGDALDVAIEEIRDTMSEEQRADPRFFPDNYDAWNAFFQRRHQRELASYDGPPPPPARNNAAGRRRWWSAPGRTLEAVLAHIEGGNYPILEMPRPQPRTLNVSRRSGSSWLPRRMATSSSSSGSASRSRSSGSAPPATPRSGLRPVKPEPESPPRTRGRGRNAGGIVIRERREPSPPRGHLRLVRPRRETGSSRRNLRTPKQEHDDAPAVSEAEEAAILEAVMARSLNDLVPADNALPMDQALAWSREDWERQEAAKQQRLLEEAALRRRAAPLVKLEESDDEWYMPSPAPARVGDPGQGTSRWGDPGQSSSQQAPATPPRFDDGDGSDDGGDDYGDYTVFYRNFGM